MGEEKCLFSYQVCTWSRGPLYGVLSVQFLLLSVTHTKIHSNCFFLLTHVAFGCDVIRRMGSGWHCNPAAFSLIQMKDYKGQSLTLLKTVYENCHVVWFTLISIELDVLTCIRMLVVQTRGHIVNYGMRLQIGFRKCKTRPWVVLQTLRHLEWWKICNIRSQMYVYVYLVLNYQTHNSTETSTSLPILCRTRSINWILNFPWCQQECFIERKYNTRDID